MIVEVTVQSAWTDHFWINSRDYHSLQDKVNQECFVLVKLKQGTSCLNLRNLVLNMTVKVDQSVASDGADHFEVKLYLDKCAAAAAAAVFGLLDCCVISEGGAETGSLPLLGLVAVEYY